MRLYALMVWGWDMVPKDDQLEPRDAASVSR